MNSPKIKGFILIALSALLWGTNGIFARFINLPSPVLLFYRFSFGMVFLLAFLYFRGTKIPFPKPHLKGIFILGLLNALVSVVAFYAFTNTSIANAEILLYSYPVYVLILAPFLIREKIDKATLVPLGISFLGLILIAVSGNVFSPNQNVSGIIAGFVAGIIFALYVLVAKRMSHHYEGLLMNFYQLAATVMILFPGFLFIRYDLSLSKLALLVIMGLFNSALAASLYFQGIKLVKAQQAGIISYIEPLSSVVYALLLFGEIPGILTVFGGILILFGGYRLVMVKK